ncbi:MAG: sulfite exporter TauE/SafE family protein [Limisphaerales bacterium]
MSAHLSYSQWACLAVAAFCSGLSKTGIAGLGILPAVLFTNVLPPRESTGALLPLLLCGDVFGVAYFRKHASWPHLWRLFTWVIIGVVAGAWALDRVNNAQAQRLIGIILLVMVALHWWRERQQGEFAAGLPHSLWFTALMGLLAGFATMVANAAGPVMVLYLLAIGLPKLVFIGTGAWFFMLVNAFKVPFSVKLGLISGNSLLMDALLLLPMIPGALLGPRLLNHINQAFFEKMVLILTLAGTIRLLW